MALVIKWSVILIGIVIIVMNLFNLAKRRLTPVLGVSWCIFAVLMLVLGSVLRLSELGKYMSNEAAFVLIIVMWAVILAFYHISLQISDLVDKTNELTMQVSLLNSENVRMMREMQGRENRKDASGEEN